MHSPKFPLGHVVATPGALRALDEAKHSPQEFLNRHVAGDWGDIDNADRRENDLSVVEGLRIFSVYRLRDGTKLWIITEADRSSTCILLPDEY